MVLTQPEHTSDAETKNEQFNFALGVRGRRSLREGPCQAGTTLISKLEKTQEVKPNDGSINCPASENEEVELHRLGRTSSAAFISGVRKLW